VSSAISKTVASAEALEIVRPKSGWKRWPKRALILLLAVWAVDFASPLVIAHSPLKRWLTWHLEAAFGRPVEVGSYSLSLWGGPAVEAHEVTVAEDIRFGHEYFLRTESLTVRLRLRSLLAGRLEPGALSLSRPTLNLVRNAAGDWNLAEWLPKPATGSATAGREAPASSAAAIVQPMVRFWRIEVDGGRINFKRGDEKLPYAFANVAGYVESQGAGRWQIDLDAAPARAAVILQQPGLLHLSGEMGGTSSRLRPATLAMTWQGASVSDVLRIAEGYDYGVRGNLAVTANARTEGSAWLIETRADVDQAHRWDLASRADNPAASLHAKMKLDFERGWLHVEEATLDTANSQVRGGGSIGWNQPVEAKRPVAPVNFVVTQSSLDLGEALAWARAFHPNIADDLTMKGRIAAKANMTGWPLRVVNVVASSDGATLSGGRLRAPVKLGAIQSRYDHGGISLQPVTVTLGPAAAASALHVDVSTRAVRNGSAAAPVLHVAGSAAQVRDVIAAASTLGWSLSRGWDVAGPMRCEMRWQLGDGWMPTQATGFLELGEAAAGGGASLRAPFINQPLEQIRAHAEIRPGVKHVTVASAEAFGARWNGTLDHVDNEEWQFAVTANHLAAAEVDRWLNPRWRESFLARVVPFLSSGGTANAAPENLRASGRLNVEQFTLAPMVVRGLRGELKIEGRRVELRDARGELFGGTASGEFEATLAGVGGAANANGSAATGARSKGPAYRARLEFAGVNMSALTEASPAFGGLFGGSASGQILMEARGASRGDLMDSLKCDGNARVKDAEVRGWDLAASLREGERRAGNSAFREASGEFTCGAKRIRVEELRLASATGDMEGSGTIDFNRNLNLQLRAAPDLATPRAARASHLHGASYQLTGPMAAPSVTVIAGEAGGTASASTQP